MVDAQTVALIRAIFWATKSLVGTAEACGVTPPTVKKYLAEDAKPYAPRRPSGNGIPHLWNRHPERERIIQLYAEGKGSFQISRMISISPQGVINIVRQAGIGRTKQQAVALKFGPKPLVVLKLHGYELFTRDEWHAMYWDPTDLPSIFELQRRLHLDVRTINEALKHHKIKKRSRLEQMEIERRFGRAKSRVTHRRYDIDVPEIVRRYQDGESVAGIAKVMDLCAGTVILRLQEAGIPIRNRHEAQEVRHARKRAKRRT